MALPVRPATKRRLFPPIDDRSRLANRESTVAKLTNLRDGRIKLSLADRRQRIATPHWHRLMLPLFGERFNMR